MISNPQPLACVLLLGALPGVGLAGHALTEPFREDPQLRRWLTPLAALGAWLIAVQLASRLCGSFVWGLWVGTLLVAGGGGYVAWRRRKLERPEQKAQEANPWIARSAALVAISMLFLAVGGQFHDETIGHLGFVAQLQNGDYPLRYQPFPSAPLAYHLGFDLICAGLTALTRIGVDAAIDLVTVVSWVFAWGLAWLLGERLAKGAGPWTAGVTLFGGGLAILLLLPLFDWPDHSLVDRAIGIVDVGAGTWGLNAPLASYMFQHPMGLGVPFGLAVLLVARTPREDDRPLLVVLLAALYIAQTAVFGVVFVALLVADLVERRWRALLPMGVVLALAYCMGGLLFTPRHSQLGLQFRLWVLSDPPGAVLLWNVLSYGLLLPLGVIGLWRLEDMRTRLQLGLVALAVGVPLVFTYQHTFDIVKFGCVGAVGLGLLAGPALSAGWRRGGWSRALLLAALPLLAYSSLAFMGTAAAGLFLEGGPPHYRFRAVELGEGDRAAAEWLRREIGPGELVYRRPAVALGYVQHAGLCATMPLRKLEDGAFGVSQGQWQQRLELMVRPARLTALQREGIGWLVIGPEDPAGLREAAAAWEQAGLIRRRYEAEGIVVFRLLPTVG